MEINNSTFLQNYQMPDGKKAGLAGAVMGRANSFKGTIQAKALEFHLDIKLLSRDELDKQGEHIKSFSLQELHLSVSQVQIQIDSKSGTQGQGAEGTNPDSGDDYWGVDKTAKRLSDFVLKGAGDDLERLQQGRSGILQGLQEAEKMWGGKLPEISYKTIDQALSTIDDRIHELGGQIVDIAA